GCQQKEASDTATSGTVASSEPQSIIVYSGRNEKLIKPVIDRFTASTDIRVQVRYGETAEMAATIMEEGPRSPADVFIAQDAAALGALSKAGMFRPLPPATVQRVPAHFSGRSREWVGLSGRARVIVYNEGRVKPADLPADLESVANPKYRGRFGVAPANASFQAQIAVFHALNGEEATRELLDAIVKNQPRRYSRNGAIVDAVISGEIDWGLVNHYYLHQALVENPNAPAKNHFMTGGGAAAFINVAGAGVLNDKPEGLRLIEYLLGDEAQRYFAEETFEYPIVEDVAPPTGLVPLSELNQPDIDWTAVSDILEQTLVLIQKSGLLQE
ncbi:MAG TPA: extracellular solute-binding protein, partial [Thermoanaerobaculia bacterium]|nr:extracellular solute-binding protein [Thermoanaerobaculia bacterium]